MIVQRILAVIAAMFLVGAVALAALGPPGVPLIQSLFLIDHDLPGEIQGFVDAHLAHWLWGYLLMPLMLRPAWLLPAVAGIICAGVSMSLGFRHAQRDRHTRRS